MKRLIMFALVLAFMAAPTSGQWVQSDSTHGTWKIFSLDTLNEWAVGNGKIILHTADGGRSIVQQQAPVNISASWFQGVYFRNPQEGWVVGSSGYSNGSGITLHTTNGGATWQQQFDNASNSNWLDITEIGNTLWKVGCIVNSRYGSGLVGKSTNNGQTWQITQLPQFNLISGIVALDAQHVVIYGNKGTLALTTNGGATWQSCGLDTNLSVYKVKFASMLVGYATTSNFPEVGAYLYRTIDGGATWHLLYTRPNAAQMSALAVLGDTIYHGGILDCIVDGINGLVKSTDGGATWQTEIVTKTAPRDIIMLDSKHGWMVTDQGFYYYTPPPPPVNHAPGWLFSVPLRTVYGGVTYRWPYQVIDADGDPIFVSVDHTKSPLWVTVDTLRKEVVLAVPFGATSYFRFTLVADDHNGGVTTLTSDSIKVDRVTHVEGETPLEFTLEQNYPNPFNPTTTISYSLPTSANVNLTVYNALGQEVARLVDGHQNIGIHGVTFSGTNLPSGMYLYKLTAGQFSATKRMLLVK